MENQSLPLMKRHLFLPLLLICLLLYSCSDEVVTTVTYTIQEPVYMLRADLREAVKVDQPHELQAPGKIYVKGKYLFINEFEKGIHVIDNSNPASPQFISFIEIPGNVDLAVKNNILYADSYIDMIALDISDPNDVKLVKRVENIFPAHGMIVNDTSKVFI